MNINDFDFVKQSKLLSPFYSVIKRIFDLTNDSYYEEALGKTRNLIERVVRKLLKVENIPVSNELASNIKKLKDNKIIPFKIANFLFDIKLYGNNAVHYDNGQPIPDKDQAEDALNFLYDFLIYIVNTYENKNYKYHSTLINFDSKQNRGLYKKKKLTKFQHQNKARTFKTYSPKNKKSKSKDLEGKSKNEKSINKEYTAKDNFVNNNPDFKKVNQTFRTNSTSPLSKEKMNPDIASSNTVSQNKKQFIYKLVGIISGVILLISFIGHLNNSNTENKVVTKDNVSSSTNSINQKESASQKKSDFNWLTGKILRVDLGKTDRSASKNGKSVIDANFLFPNVEFPENYYLVFNKVNADKKVFLTTDIVDAKRAAKSKKDFKIISRKYIAGIYSFKDNSLDLKLNKIKWISENDKKYKAITFSTVGRRKVQNEILKNLNNIYFRVPKNDAQHKIQFELNPQDFKDESSDTYKANYTLYISFHYMDPQDL